MRARPLVMYLTLVAIGVVAGFFLSSRVMAGSAQPGSAADPLVSKSYVDQQVAALNKQIADLEQAVAQLQKQQGITPIQPAPATQTAQPVQTSAAKQVYIKAENNSVNLRQGPGTNYSIVGTLGRGKPSVEPMTMLAQNSGWDQVRLPDGRTGWISGSLVELR